MDPLTMGAMSAMAVSALGSLFDSLGSESGKRIVGYVADRISQLNIKHPDQVIQQKSVPDINNFETFQTHLAKILRLLDCHSKKVSDCKEGGTIAIVGPPGVGKAAIMKNLNNHEKIPKMFEIVMWIEAKGTKEELQKKIARRLKLNLEGSEEIAGRIAKKLKDKKYLLLLNGVKEVIKLEDIGIPDNKNCSKVVLTAESREVCSRMKAIVEEVEGLNSDEAWKMFIETIGDKINLPRVAGIAPLVVKACDGIPLLIQMVANAFALYENVSQWWNGLSYLQNLSDLQNLSEDTKDLTDYHNFFEHCYNNLSDERKICFLYGALHPASTKISLDYLVKCWAAEGFLGSIDDRNSLCSACSRGRTTLGYLNNLYLLKAEERTDNVEVSNTVHRVALHISSKDPTCKPVIGDFCKLVIGDNTNISPAPHNVSSEEATRIFVIGTRLKILPNVETCHNRHSLPQINSDLEDIPPFCTTIQKLQDLNLRAAGITSLSLSPQQLTERRALFLKDCKSLTDLPPQINHHLLVLDIRGCEVIFIPTSIGELSCLRSLRVSYYKPTNICGHKGQRAGDGKVISRLSKLEELIIDVDMNSYNQWSTEAEGIIEEVAILDKLISLGIVFPRIEVFSRLMRRRGTQYCHPLSFLCCIVGENISIPEIPQYLNCSIPRFLRWEYQSCDQNSLLTNVFWETDALELAAHPEIKCLSDFIRRPVGEGDQNPGLNTVCGCLVDSCSNMTTIVNGNNAGDFILLPILQHLHLRNLSRLSSIFEGGRLSKGSLSNLHTIVVEHCGIVKIMISSNSVIQHLPNLKKLTIRSCKSVENLFEITADKQSMQNLETLELIKLEKLTSICCQHKSLAWPSLKLLRVCMCPKLKTLPLGKKNAVKLEFIQGEPNWWNALRAKKLKERVSFIPSSS